MKPLDTFIKNKFGSKQGLLKNVWYRILFWIGMFKRYEAEISKAAPIKRFVFVCAGNICRSPLAEKVATSEGFSAISFGLDTRGGDPADIRAQDFALANGIDMSEHVTRKINAYKPLPGDLVIAMEPKHLSMYKKHRLDAPITLLGLFRNPGYPYIHDPFNTNTAFFSDCEFKVVELTKKALKYGQC